MDKLEPAVVQYDPVKDAEIIEDTVKLFPKFSKEQVAAILEIDKSLKHFMNDTYMVAMAPEKDGIIWLTVKRLDKEPIRDWRDMQEIKNQLVGPENEAVEIYPAESRLVDTANQYHIYVFADPTYRIPFGFNGGRMVASVAGRHGKQRPRPEDELPPPLTKEEVWACRTPLPEPEPPTPDPEGQFCVTRDMTKRRH